MESDVSQNFKIKRGDTSPQMVYQLDPPVSLVNASVVFNMGNVGDPPTIQRAVADVIDSEASIVGFSFTEEQTDLAGFYRAEFEVTHADGSIETYPNDDYILVIITQDLG